MATPKYCWKKCKSTKKISKFKIVSEQFQLKFCFCFKSFDNVVEFLSTQVSSIDAYRCVLVSISPTFYELLLWEQKAKKDNSLTVFFALLRSVHIKADPKMLVKWTTGVDFINFLWAAFAPVYPKSIKRYWWPDWTLTLLGATGVKAVCKYVVEIEP